MTWSAHATVTSVKSSEAEDTSSITATANVDDMYGTVPAIASNTEGKLTRVVLQFTIDGPCSLREGDVIAAYGSFTNQPAGEAPGTPTAG